MTGFWRNWLMVWAAAVAIFGLVFVGAAFPATDAPARLFLAWLERPAGIAMLPPERFALGLLGAVVTGWACTLLATLRGAWALGDAGQPVWRLLTLGVVGWFVVDSAISVATGFERNVLSNFVFVAAYLWPVLRTGVLGHSPRGAAGIRAT